MIAVLHGLATLDGAFAGFRAAQGRSGIVRRTRADLRAMAWGAGWIQPPLLALEGLAAAVGAFDDLAIAGPAMAAVFLSYAGFVGLGFLAKLTPWFDVRAAASVIVLGPGTLLRPVVLIGGAAAAIAAHPAPRTAVFAALLVVAALGTGWWLDRRCEVG